MGKETRVLGESPLKNSANFSACFTLNTMNMPPDIAVFCKGLFSVRFPLVLLENFEYRSPVSAQVGGGNRAGRANIPTLRGGVIK